MNQLDTHRLVIIVDQLNEKETFRNIIGVVRDLLTPYLSVLDQGTDIGGIIQWLRQIFTDKIITKLLDIISNEMETIVNEKFHINEDDTDDEDGTLYDQQRNNRIRIGLNSELEWVDELTMDMTFTDDNNIAESFNHLQRIISVIEDINMLDIIKSKIASYLIKKLFQSKVRIGNKGIHYERAILPWDIQAAFNRLVLPIHQKGDKLNVMITIGDKVFNHMLSVEFTCGLLLFCQISGNHFNVSMSDDIDDIYSDTYVICAENEHLEMYQTGIHRYKTFDTFRNAFDESYTVEINNKSYLFFTTDFMRGFSTGALWAKVDHHTLWKNLKFHRYEDHSETIMSF